MPEITTITVRDIDLDQWRRLRIVCLREDKTLAEKLNEIIAHELKRKEG